MSNVGVFFFSMADCYWVGKASLRSWKRLAMEKLREKEKETANTNGNNHQQQGTSYSYILLHLLRSQPTS